MKISQHVPHFAKRGGTRLVLTLANALVDMGYDAEIVTDRNDFNGWMPLSAPIVENRPGYGADIIISLAPPAFERTLEMSGAKWMNCVHSIDHYLRTYRRHAQDTRWKGMITNNAARLVKLFPDAKIPVIGCDGPTDLDIWHPRKPIVGYWKTNIPYKGTKLIEDAIAGLDEWIFAVPISDLDDFDLVETYHELDYFISWEQEGGWSNTAAEALACGCRVITNGINCEPFLDKCIVVRDLRAYLTSPDFRTPMHEFSARPYAERVLRAIGVLS